MRSRLEDEAVRRAYEGVERPVFQGGKQVGVVREYSDTLLIFLLKALRPEKYRGVVPKTRRGTPCQCPAMENGRCRLHGGLSTGPKTREGIEPIRQAQWKHGPIHQRSEGQGSAVSHTAEGLPRKARAIVRPRSTVRENNGCVSLILELRTLSMRSLTGPI
jgi:hypothetical protein